MKFLEKRMFYRLFLIFVLTLFIAEYVVMRLVPYYLIDSYKNEVYIDLNNALLNHNSNDDVCVVEYESNHDGKLMFYNLTSECSDPFTLELYDKIVKSSDIGLEMIFNERVYFISYLYDEERLFVSYIDKTDVYEIIDSITMIIHLVVSPVFVIFIFLGLLIVRSITKSLDILLKQVSYITDKDINQKLDINRKDEIGNLSKAIEKLRLDLLEKENKQRDVFQNISHNLKTPIMVIQSYTEAIKDGVFTHDDMDIPLAVITEETERLDRRVRDILTLTKLEHFYESDILLHDIYIKDLIEDVINRMKLKNKDIKWNVEIKDVLYFGNEEMWVLVIENILSNAIRYAKSVIKVTVSENIIALYNDGEKVSDEMLDIIFQPYEKGKSGEFGMGMAIVYKTLQIFGYEIEVRNTKEGVLFIISKYT